MGLDSEPPHALGVALKTAEASNQRQLGPHVPRSPSGEEVALLLRRQLEYLLQVHLDTSIKRRLNLFDRITEDGDVEVRADRFPALAASVRKASKCQAHASSGTSSLHGGAANGNVRLIAVIAGVGQDPSLVARRTSAVNGSGGYRATIRLHLQPSRRPGRHSTDPTDPTATTWLCTWPVAASSISVPASHT